MAFSMCLGGLLGHTCTPLPSLHAHESIHTCTFTHTSLSAILEKLSFPPNTPHYLLDTGLSLYQDTLPPCYLMTPISPSCLKWSSPWEPLCHQQYQPHSWNRFFPALCSHHGPHPFLPDWPHPTECPAHWCIWRIALDPRLWDSQGRMLGMR